VLEIAARFLEQGVLSRVSTQLVLAEPPAPPSASNVAMAMSYQPFAGTMKPDHQRPPFWVLASGALLCSSLGAVTAIAYSVASDPAPQELEPEAPSAAARPVGVAPAAILPAAVVPAGGIPAASAPAAVVAAPASCPQGMALIRGGKFFMGSDSSHPALQYAQPAHAVSVDTFCLGTREVSVSEYQECVSNGACGPAHLTSDLGSDDGETVSSASKQRHDEQCNAGKAGRERDPINCVSHGQAASYCAFLAGRLASEAEWEFAARGEANRRFPWGNTPATAEHANTCGKECARWHEEAGLSSELHGVMFDQDDGYAGTAPVGSYPAGATSDGVLDLIGNVFEWTSGGLYAYDHTPRNNPHGPGNGDSFVIRGGNFKSGTPEFSDPALRFAMLGDSYSHGVGFRCASDASTVR
jgi:formylglycine-generating enzyme required for sulfatase activity